MANNNTNLLIKVLSALFSAFCGGKSSHDDGQQQQQGYPGQQQQYQQQQPYSNQQQAYPGQYPPQQQQYQPPNQQSWSQVAGGSSPQHYQNNHNNQHRPPHHQNNYQQNNQHHQQQQQQHQNGGYQSKPYGGLPSGGILGPHAPQHQNQDQVNAANDKYQNLRNQARQAGDEAHRCFAASQEAYQRGDGGKAHDLSQEGKTHQRRQDQLDDEASEWIFIENNRDSPPGTIDLHGLYVKEAIERTEAAIAQAQRERRDELRVIVGKGIHSQGHVAKIKPAVQNLMQKYNLSAHIDPSNTGVLIVDLDGRENNGRTRDAGGLVDEMERGQGGDCVIM